MRKFAPRLWAVACLATLVSMFGSAMVERLLADISTPISLSYGVTVSENFTSMLSSGNASPAATPAGWGVVETGTGANGAYTVGTGSSNAGDTYSFGGVVTSGNGTAPAPDRAFGGLRSGTVVPTIGASFVNNTGSTIGSLVVSYTGEQWRLGTAARGGPDRLDFQIGVAATSLSSGGYADVDALDFTGPIAAGTVGALDGNAPANRVGITATISNLSIPNGATFFIRWVDVDVANADDGLAIDDFSLTPFDRAPTVASTVPAASALNVAVDSTVTVTFSEQVTAAANAFAFTCNSNPVAFTPSASPATSFTLTPAANLPFDSACVVQVTAGSIADTDSFDPPDQMSGAVSFSFTTASPTDVAPAVVSTSPADDAANVPITSNIVIDFSENVNASSTAFTLNCDGSQTFALSNSGVGTITIDPDVDLPYETECTINITGTSVSDADSNDPPDTLAANVTFAFTTEAEPLPVANNIIINEIDVDQAGTDAGEFVELFDGGVGNTSLAGLTVVFFNGSNDLSYAAFDLDGFSTDASGYFTLGNALVPGRDVEFADNLLQQGADAVALYAANATDFPNNTPITLTNLHDAVVYDSDDADDAGLLALLNAGEPQVNENAGNSITTHSLGRCDNGTGGARNTSTYLPATPSPGAANNCPPPPPPPPPPSNSKIVISQVYGGGGNAGAAYQNDFVELFNRSNVTVDTLGWSLQYASAAGSGWDFNKTPLGGPIAPGEYYLVKLATNSAVGLEVPPANVSGPINLSGSNGKIALVSSFEALSGSCPTANPNLQDFVGYGTADCFEGAGAAPAPPSVSSALLRNNGGLTDTNTNSADLVAGNATPRRTAPIVELPPFVLSTDPSTNDTNVPRDPTITITFTEPVDVAPSWFDLTCVSSGPHNDSTLAANGRVFHITPNVNLLAGEQCTMTIVAGNVQDQDLDDSAPNTNTLLANHTWSFTVATGTAPPYPASVHLTLGNPSNAIADIGQPQNYLMEKPEFTLSYNRDQGRPNWVSWHLSNDWYGSLERFDTFRADPQVPPDWYRVQGTDFAGSGFDRGHMVPNADRDKETSIPINQATFLMTNMVAQAGGNNSGPWGELEGKLRDIADEGNELYIVAGPEGIGGTGDFGGVTTTIAGGKVTVPSNTWKVALVLPKLAGDDLSRVTCATRTIAVIMPNVETIADDGWEDFLTNVDAVEALTGYDLFANLPDDVEYCVEKGINGLNPPPDLAPPVISCAAADGAWHAGNVALACTASDGASGLASSSDAAFSLVTSVAGGVETANASTDTRVVCDAVGNCATAGPIAGNKIDRKAPVITIATPTSGASYPILSTVNASFVCADAGSGPANCTGTVANGSAIDTSSAGAKSFSVTATDAVGNSASASVGYTVLSAAQQLQQVSAELNAIIAASTKAQLTARATAALRKVEDAMAELSETPVDAHHAAISIRQAVQQIEGLRSQGLLSAAAANALLAQLAAVNF